MTALAATPVSAPPRARRQRIPFWDNARFAAITLVVVGHGIEKLTSGSDAALALYIFIYAFHMPAFAIISGYFSKATPPGRRQMLKLITDILIPYIVLQAIWTLVQFLVQGKSSFNPSQPHWTLWYLLALAIFRVALPYLILLRWPLLWAVACAVGVGYLSTVDSTFSLSRAIGLLPLFLLGWKMRQWRIIDRWRVMRSRAWVYRVVALLIMGAWAAVVVVFIGPFRKFDLSAWLTYDDSYSALGTVQWWSGGVRLALLALAVLLSFAFMVLIPRRETWFSTFGQATMYVYLLHSFVLYPLRETGIFASAGTSVAWLLSMVLASIAISIALSSPWVRKVFRPLIEPKPMWLFTREEKPAIVASELGGRRPDQKVSRVDPTGSRRS